VRAGDFVGTVSGVIPYPDTPGLVLIGEHLARVVDVRVEVPVGRRLLVSKVLGANDAGLVIWHRVYPEKGEYPLFAFRLDRLVSERDMETLEARCRAFEQALSEPPF
jgi:hypothetical protein